MLLEILHIYVVHLGNIRVQSTVSIQQANAKKGEERYVTAFYWPKLDFAVIVNHLHSKEEGSVDSSGREG